MSESGGYEATDCCCLGGHADPGTSGAHEQRSCHGRSIVTDRKPDSGGRGYELAHVDVIHFDVNDFE